MEEVKMCACGDRPADQCDEEWGPDCDLGNNEKHARVSNLPELGPQVEVLNDEEERIRFLIDGIGADTR